MLAFVIASLVGGALLSLPMASEGAGRAPLLTALFTAASAVCVTGLIVVDTGAYWSTFGEWTILGLIQVGGFGIMTISSLIIFVVARRLGLRQRLIAAAETGSLNLGDVRRLLIGVALFSFAVEAVVAVALAMRFWLAYDEAFGRAVYLGVFHSVSAFNNAGFSPLPNSLVGLNRDPFVLVVMAAAVVIGGLGFLVWVQIARRPLGSRRWNVHAKVTLATSAVLIAGGWALFALFEWTNPGTLGPMSAPDSLVNALFHSVVPRTAGFNSVDMASLRDPSVLLTEILMFIGGGSGSTAGGIKVTTFALLGWVLWAELRGDADVTVFERRVPGEAQRQALTVALTAIGVVMLATLALLATTPLPRGDLQFEAISALATVGMSTGATPLLSAPSRLVVIVVMIIGRVGPPTLFAALVLRERNRQYRYAEERPMIG